MTDGSSKNIEDIRPGDRIKSVNISSLEVEDDTVVVVPDSREFYGEYEIRFSNGNQVNCSAHYPIYVIGKGWSVIDVDMAKKDLNFDVYRIEVGDNVYQFDNGNLVRIKVTTIREVKKEVEMYDMKYVKKNNTFFANGILVHNRYQNK